MAVINFGCMPPMEQGASFIQNDAIQRIDKLPLHAGIQGEEVSEDTPSCRTHSVVVIGAGDSSIDLEMLRAALRDVESGILILSPEPTAKLTLTMPDISALNPIPENALEGNKSLPPWQRAGHVPHYRTLQKFKHR